LPAMQPVVLAAQTNSGGREYSNAGRGSLKCAVCAASQIQRKGTQMVTVGLVVRLEAKPGKEREVAAFLQSALPLMQNEPATTTWFALRFGPSTFGIFDAFAEETGRQAHLAGRVAAALMARAAELLAVAPTIEKVDVLANKLPESA
jgi:quinol monooxygenase YgiN